MSRFRVVGAAVLAVVLVPSAASAASITTGHTGSGRPALAFASDRLYVAWAGSSGTAAAKELVIGYSTSKGLRVTKIANGELTPANEGPALSADGSGVYVAWAAGNNHRTLTAAYTTGRALSCRTAFTGVVAVHAPAMATDLWGVRYLAWIDPGSHLNVARLDSSACVTTQRMALTNRVTLADTAVGAPALVYDDNVQSSNLGLVVAWPTGNAIGIGSFTGGATLAHRTQVSAPGSADGVGLSSGNADLYLSYRGPDGKVYLAYSEGCTTACFDQHVSATGEQASGGVGLPSVSFGLFRSFFDLSGHLVIVSL
jgi:hypothetical protein